MLYKKDVCIQAGMFYIPRCVWLICEGGLMAYIVKGEISDINRVRPLNLVFFCLQKLRRTPLFSAVCGPIWQKFWWTFDLGSG